MNKHLSTSVNLPSFTLPTLSNYDTFLNNSFPSFGQTVNFNQPFLNTTFDWQQFYPNAQSQSWVTDLFNTNLFNSSQCPSLMPAKMLPSIDSKVVFQSIPCPQQHGLSCVFHSIKNAARLQETNGRATISHTEALQLDSLYPQLRQHLHNPEICHVCKFEKSGGIVLDPYVTPIRSNNKFMTALNQLKMKQRESITCVVLFQSHAVALHISTNANGQMVLNVADSDSPLTMHPNTQKALNLVASECLR